MRRTLRMIAAVLALVPAVAGASDLKYQVTVLSDSPAWITGLNDNGQYLFNHNSSGHLVDGYGPDAGNSLYVGSLGWVTSATALNNAGDVVGSAYTADHVEHAFISRDGQIQDLGTLGGPRSFATAVNSRGQVVGLADTADRGMHPFLYSDGKMVDLDPSGWYSSAWAYAINDHGQVLMAQGSSPVVYQDGKFTYLNDDLLPAGGYPMRAEALNNAGDVVGEFRSYGDSTDTLVYRWNANGDDPPRVIANLGPDGYLLKALLSDDGQVAMMVEQSNEVHALLMQGGRTYDLNELIPSDSGWTIESVMNLNENGQILAAARDANHGAMTVVLTPEGQPTPAAPMPVPEPSTIALFGTIVGGLAWRTWRARGR